MDKLMASYSLTLLFVVIIGACIPGAMVEIVFVILCLYVALVIICYLKIKD